MSAFIVNSCTLINLTLAILIFSSGSQHIILLFYLFLFYVCLKIELDHSFKFSPEDTVNEMSFSVFKEKELQFNVFLHCL